MINEKIDDNAALRDKVKRLALHLKGVTAQAEESSRTADELVAQFQENVQAGPAVIVVRTDTQKFHAFETIEDARAFLMARQSESWRWIYSTDSCTWIWHPAGQVDAPRAG